MRHRRRLMSWLSGVMMDRKPTHDGRDRDPDPEWVRRVLSKAAGGEAADAHSADDDPELTRAVDRQRRVASLLAAGGPHPPERLRARLDTLEAGRTGRAAVRVRARRRGVTVAAGLIAIAAAVIAVVLATGGVRREGDAAPLSASRIAAAAWQLPTSNDRPPVDRGDVALLATAFHGTRFPNYRDGEGWHPSGARAQTLAGRRALTVYYRTGARHATYTVVAGDGVVIPSWARRFAAGAHRMVEYRDRAIWVIAFRDHGNTCVLAAAAPRERRWLVRLASWRARGRSTTD